MKSCRIHSELEQLHWEKIQTKIEQICRKPGHPMSVAHNAICLMCDEFFFSLNEEKNLR